MHGSIVPLVFVLAIQLPTAPPSRDAAPRDPSTHSKGTGIIRGRVTDRETGQPLSRVLVLLLSGSLRDDPQPEQNVDAQLEPRETLTDRDGRFEYREVQAGSYLVAFDASQLRGTHLPQTFGELGPENESRASRRGRFFLKNGEVRSDVNAALSRALAIEGHVLDEFGEPLANLSVGAQPWDKPTQGFMGMPRFTDDHGAFRLFGLKPGDYRVCASADMHVGSLDDGQRLIQTCYPAASDKGSAQPVTLVSSDVTGIDIAVQRNRGYKVTGTAVDSTGAPIERPQVNFASQGAQNDSVGVRILGGGRFVAQGVAPGEYMLRVSSASISIQPKKREQELGFLPIRVDSADVEGVVVSTGKPARVAGRVIFEDGLPATLGNPLRVVTRPDLASPVGRVFQHWGQWQDPVEVRQDLTFELTDLFGPKIVSVAGQPREWVLRSVRYRGEDVTDVGVEFTTSSDPRNLEIVLTKQAALVSGRVLDDAGEAPEEAFVVLLAGDAAKRRAVGHEESRAAMKGDGTFRLGPVRAGEYTIVALSGPAMMGLALEDEKTHERIASLGKRIVLSENEQRTIDLRVAKP